MHPHYREVLQTYRQRALDLEIVELAVAGATVLLDAVDAIAAELSDDVACVVVQYPNFFGGIEDVRGDRRRGA